MRKPAREAQILVCVKYPGEEPRVEPLFDNTLAAFQEAVGGYIEAVTLCTDLVLICNEEGRIRGLPYNTTICDCQFYGPVLAVGTKGVEFASLKAHNIPMVLTLLAGDQEDERCED
jgi:hypothetical protein